MSIKLSYPIVIVSIILEIIIINTTLYNTTVINAKFDSIILFLSGIIVSFLPLVITKGKTKVFFSNTRNDINTFEIKIKPYFIYLDWLIKITFLLLLVYFIRKASFVFLQTPIDYKIADMLPIIKIMIERYFTGDSVYKTIPQIWNGIQPIYLPAMWLAFAPAYWFNFDMRWVTFFALIITPIIFTYENLKQKQILEYLPFLTMASFYIYIMLVYDSRILSMTEEPLVIFYYALLIYAFWKQSIKWIALALTLCILSRYSIIAFATVYAIYYFLFMHKKNTILVVLLTIFLCTLFMFFFQGLNYLKIFITLPNNYINAIINDRDKYEPLINNSIGLAKFVRYENLPILHRFQLIMTFLSPALLIAFAHKFIKNKNHLLIAVCSLKVSLVFCYSFIVMPYVYLFYPSVFISIIIMKFILEKKTITFAHY